MPASVRNAAEIETAIAALGREPGGALIVLPSTVAAVNGDLIVELAARYRLPAIYSDRPFVLQGGLFLWARFARHEPACDVLC
jgi:putative tryptophan/tyrosine transport system substrate-binding protein